MGVTVVPFPTAVLAEFIGHRGASTAAAVYGATFTVIGLLFNLLWWYAAHNGRLLDPTANPRVVRSITQQYALGPPLYFASFILAFVNVAASLAVYLLLALFFALPGTAIRRRPRLR